MSTTISGTHSHASSTRYPSFEEKFDQVPERLSSRELLRIEQARDAAEQIEADEGLTTPVALTEGQDWKSNVSVEQ